MPDLKTLAADLRKEIDTKKAEAATAWQAFDDLRSKATEEGVDALKDEDAFKKLDEAGRAYDAKRDEIVALEGKWARTVEMAAEDGEGKDHPLDGGPTHVDGPGGKDGQPTRPVSAGQKFLDSDVYAELEASGKLGMADARIETSGVKVYDREELKTLLSPDAGSAGDVVRPDRTPLWVLTGEVSLDILDLVYVGDTDSDLVEWIEETTFTNAAAETAEDTAAPESTLVYDLKTGQVKEITHFIPATKRILADGGQLRTIVDAKLIYGVRKRLASQIINGDGTGENLTGIVNTSGILTQALGSDSRSDAVHKAITKIRVQEEEPFAIGIHPNDAEQLFLEKDANGAYIYGPPSMPQRNSIWGLRPVVNSQFPEGTPVVGDYRQFWLWLREGVSLAASDSHSDYFTKRKVALLASMRAAGAVVQKNAFCTVTGF